MKCSCIACRLSGSGRGPLLSGVQLSNHPVQRLFQSTSEKGHPQTATGSHRALPRGGLDTGRMEGDQKWSEGQRKVMLATSLRRQGMALCLNRVLEISKDAEIHVCFGGLPCAVRHLFFWSRPPCLLSCLSHFCCQESFID